MSKKAREARERMRRYLKRAAKLTGEEVIGFIEVAGNPVPLVQVPRYDP